MERRYIKSFQGLRFFAMLLIFIAHSGELLSVAGIDIFGPRPGYGALGVTLFFMLSGYLAQMKFAGGVIKRKRKFGARMRKKLLARTESIFAASLGHVGSFLV